MNSYFAQVMEVATRYGGDVSKFAGDAMLIVFEPTDVEVAAAEVAVGGQGDGGLSAATRRAAVAMKKLVDDYGKKREFFCFFCLFLLN